MVLKQAHIYHIKYPLGVDPVAAAVLLSTFPLPIAPILIVV